MVPADDANLRFPCSPIVKSAEAQIDGLILASNPSSTKDGTSATDDRQPTRDTRGDDWRRLQAVEGTQEIDQITPLRFGEVQFGNLRILADDLDPPAAPPSVIVEFDDLFEGAKETVVHIRRGLGDVAKAWGLELSEPIAATKTRAPAASVVTNGDELIWPPV